MDTQQFIARFKASAAKVGYNFLKSEDLIFGHIYRVQHLRYIKTKFGPKLQAIFPEGLYIVPQRISDNFTPKDVEEFNKSNQILYMKYMGRGDFGACLFEISAVNDANDEENEEDIDEIVDLVNDK